VALFPPARLLISAVVAIDLFFVACGGSSSPHATPSPAPPAAPTIDLARLADWVKPAFNQSTALPGRYFPPNPGPDGRLLTRDDMGHFDNGIRYPDCTDRQIASNQIGGCYHTNPPTSGPHAASPMPWGVLPNPALRENLVHNMEHGGVVIWYNTSNTSAVTVLREVTREAIQAGRLVVLSAYPDMETDTIALTSWTRLDKFGLRDLSAERVRVFIDAHERRFNPENF
jgi:hypothetical protein